MSRNPFRLVFPRKGWAALRWHHEYRVSTHLRERMDKLADISGVRYQDGWSIFEFPMTTWRVPGVLELVSDTVGMSLWDQKRPRPQRRGADLLKQLYPDFLASLYPWQVEAIDHALANGCGLVLADAMGLGKTRAAIGACLAAERLLQPGGGGLKVIVGPGYTRDVWRRELIENGIVEPEGFVALKGRSPSRKPLLHAEWLFVHYDIAYAWRTIVQTVRRPLTCVLDEVHWLKNPRAQRTKGSRYLAAGARFVMELTGTPMANRVGELYAPLTLVTGSNTWGTHGGFRRRYAGALSTPYGLKDMRPSNIEELQTRMAPYYLRRTIHDIGGAIPPMSRTRVSTELTEKEASALAAVTEELPLEELVHALLTGRAGQETLSIMNELRMRTSALKLPATCDYVSDLRVQGEASVVFCWQRKTVDELAKRLGKQNPEGCVYTLHGGHSQEQRDLCVAAFQAPVHDEADVAPVLVATYGVLREGVTLTRARSVVLHDLDWVPSTILQAEARVHRLGQTRACVAAWSLVDDSMDTILARVLLMKADHIEKTLGIGAAQQAVQELELEDIAGYQDLTDWATDMLKGWAGR